MSDTVIQLQQPGAIGIIATDTVYGVVARATDRQAVQRLYASKKREAKPGTIIAATTAQLEALGLKHRYLKAVEQFWPGAVSVIVPTGPDLQYLHQGKLSLAVRIPADERLHKLLLQTGPLLTSSANQPSQPVATTISQAKVYFGAAVDFYEDGGDMGDAQPSTIIRIIDDAIEIVRQGAVQVNVS